MTITISENTKAILLLTSFFNNNELRQCKPLTVNGYGYFARWLHTYGYKPTDLLKQNTLSNILEHWQHPESHTKMKQKVELKSLDRTIADITPERIKTLLARGTSLSMALDKWSAAGIWVLDRSHPNYPIKIKKALKDQAPAILFGVGNADLLLKPAIGFVGSRDCDKSDENATIQYVETINQNGLQVVSGAANGVDSHAMLASLENGHSSIGIVADSLFKASVDKRWRDHLKNDQLVLITPFYPEAKFSGPNAMQRNKFIYIMSQASIVIRTAESNANKKSGTWEGAKENLQKGWVPLMVSEHVSPNYPANQALLNGKILKAQVVPQVITPSVSSDDFTVLLNVGTSQQTDQQTMQRINSRQDKSASIDDMFAVSNDETAETQTSAFQTPKEEFPQRPKRVTNNSYADKDEIDFSSINNNEVVQSDDKKDEYKSSETINNSPEAIENKKVDFIDPNSPPWEVEKTKTEDNINTKPSCESNNESDVSYQLVFDSEEVNKNSISTANSDDKVSTDTATKKASLSPISEALFRHIELLIEATADKKITHEQLENEIPECDLLGKTAFNKWIKYLIEQEYLQQPQRKKIYYLNK